METFRDPIFDWNDDASIAVTFDRPVRKPELNDETLRDGLHSRAAKHPTMAAKFVLLDLMEELGVDSANIGRANAGDTLELAQYVSRQRYQLAVSSTIRPLLTDCAALVEMRDRSGLPVEGFLLLERDGAVEQVRDSVSFLGRRGVPVMFGIDDSTRAGPEDLRQLYLAAVGCGAARVCLTDAGHSTPSGAFRLVRFMRELLQDAAHPEVKLDWHGHNDRGLAVINALAALAAGVDRVHAAALGVGDRCGSTAMEQLLVNLKLHGWRDRDLGVLHAYCDHAARSLEIDLPYNYPVFGFHDVSVIRALQRPGAWLADQISSGASSNQGMKHE